MTTNDSNYAAQLATVQARIRAAEMTYGRPSGAVELLAVSKTFPAVAIAAMHRCGQRRFGENYAQEAAKKMADLAALDIEWHFIGHIQSNKTRDIAARFAWIHSIDRLSIAQRLNDQRPDGAPPLNVCIELNIDAETRKAGVDVAALPGLAIAVAGLPRLRLRGLMALPAPRDDFVEQRAAFARVTSAFDDLRAAGFALDTLSMGTSGDLEAAIAAGATMVRIGTALFGSRLSAP